MMFPLAVDRAAALRPKSARYEAWRLAREALIAAWDSGARPAPSEIPAFLSQVPEEQRRDARADLAAEILFRAWREGPGPLLDSLHPDPPPSLVEDEFLARHQCPFGDAPSVEEYENWFPGSGARLSQRCLGGGRWVLLRAIGRTEMGRVWVAHDRALGTLVALKQPGPREDSVPRLHREAKFLQELEHESIPRVLDTRLAGPGFFVMPLYEGPTLAAKIESGGSTEELLNSLQHVVSAVQHAHRRGIVHGDLKPGNVIDGRPAILLDWGLARRVGELPDAWVAGTPESMAPEQLDGVADERTDVFGLGAILYSILTGRSLYRWTGPGRPEGWEKTVRQRRFARPRRVAPGIAERLEEVCLHALSASPDRRHPSAAAFGEDLRHAAARGIRNAGPPGACARVLAALTSFFGKPVFFRP